MKQQYQSPEVEITPIYTSNVFTASGSYNDGPFDLEDDTP